jgi:beta-lactamase regulating signal transducer with metallopeptidase domain
LPAAIRWPGLLPNPTVVVPAQLWQTAREFLPGPAKPVAEVASGRAQVRHEARNAVATGQTIKDATQEKAREGMSALPFVPGTGRYPAPAISNVDVTAEARRDLPAMEARPVHSLWSWLPLVTAANVAWLVYLLVSAALLLRLTYGALSAVLLWLSAQPVAPDALPHSYGANLKLRRSREISSPLTIGSGVLLPEDFCAWDARKLRIVLAHERSHVRQGDFYLQLLAGIYTAIFWFSPLGWWLKRKLSGLSETISDRAGLREAASRSSYAQILIEFAVAPRSTYAHSPFGGVAMARPSHLTERIEKLLNESSFHHAFAGSRGRVLAAVLLVPTALIGATALVRVEAAAKPAPHPAASALAAAQPTPAAQAKPQVAAVQSISVEAPAPAGGISTVQVNATPMLEAFAAPPAPPMPAAEPAAGAASASGADERQPAATFERTLSLNGQAQLSVATGSGDIVLSRGSGSQIHVRAKIFVSREGNQEEARQIAANPPIEQNGNVIHIGQHQEHWRGISIDYQIEAPADTQINATSGSGDIADTGVGQNAKLTTGSGNIDATGLSGGFYITTGSGDVRLEDTGEGDSKAQTGSGNIEIKGVHGSLVAGTGSGDIKATGTPSSPWKLGTGSGNVELWLGSTGFTLDASTGSGSISTDHEMMMQGDLNRHHIIGKVNGGGPTVRIETGSGDIHVH